ncbi:MAG: substrate-binding domain-containing protein [Bacteroidia bacterium]
MKNRNIRFDDMRSIYALFFLILVFSLFTFCTQQSTSASGESGASGLASDSVSRPSTSPSPGAAENVTRGEIYIAVDESLLPVVRAEVDNFQAVYDGAVVHTVVLPGEEAIHAMLVSDSIRLVITSRKLRKEEEVLLETLTTPAEYAVMGKDAVALVVNRDNPVKELTTAQVKDIFSGTIKSWKKINAQAPSDKISLIFDHARSGTMAFLRDSLMDGKPITQDGTFAMKSTPEVFDYIAENPGAVGIVGMAWLSDQDDPAVKERLSKVRILFLEKSASPDAPCAYAQQFFGPYQSFLDQDCYPLTRKIYSISRETGIGLGTGLVAYIDGPQGQRIIHKSGLAAIHTIPRKVKLPDESMPATTTKQKPATTKENDPGTGKR